jgi:hypothetical protein
VISCATLMPSERFSGRRLTLPHAGDPEGYRGGKELNSLKRDTTLNQHTLSQLTFDLSCASWPGVARPLATSLRALSLYCHVTSYNIALCLLAVSPGCRLPHCFMLHCHLLHCFMLHCLSLHCFMLHCLSLHCFMLHCLSLHRFMLHCHIASSLCRLVASLLLCLIASMLHGLASQATLCRCLTSHFVA